MASRKEIHSTDKLLELIRSETEQSPDFPAATDMSQQTGSRSLIRSISMKKKYVIGVDIGHTSINMAKVAHFSNKNFELVDYCTLRPSWAFSINDDRFQELLKTSLDRFCGGARIDIWSAIPSAKVEIRCLRVPKIARNQIPNAIFWTFTKMVEFNETDEILDYEILGDVSEQGVKKTEVMTFKVPKKEVNDLKKVFEKISYPLKGISIVPFAVQNLFRTGVVTYPEQDVCSLFVGRDWSRIIIFSGGNLVLSRGIKAGMQSMVETIHAAMHPQEEQQPVPSVSASMANDIDSIDAADSPFIHPDAQKAFFAFLGVPGVTEQPTPRDDHLNSTQVFQMILPAMERLIRQVERTFEHYVHNFHRESVRRVFLSGQISANALIAKHIGLQLELPVTVLNPFGSDSAFAQKVKIPETQEEKESYVPAIGLALSSNTMTPNVLYTHRHKDRVESVRRMNMQVLAVCMLCLLVLIGIFSFQQKMLDSRRENEDKLNRQLSAYQPPAEKEIMLALYAQTKNKRQIFNRIVRRYTPVAVVNELAQITPANIRLLAVDITFSKSQLPKSGTTSTIILDGIIFNSNDNFEATLTNYLLSLKNSSLFLKPEIQSRQMEYYNEQGVLRFKAKLEII